ncbi:MAG: DUF1573 domain-containing protein [Muribaculaceae bacterium]|nr:DUF1573 domain-containing protein [Muribaculaceae bacterium]MEE1297110.1 DUF1573 domain-containing protein [Muribaculaceae bacterium]
MKRFLIAITAAMIAFGLVAADNKKYAQGTFPKRVHDFGIIKEEKGPVSTTFEVVNTGNKPLIIVDVTVSCGCTSREFTKKPIAPGKKGKVKVIYSPEGRPGAFKKDIKVHTNGREKRTTLFIEGTTVPKLEE